MCCLYLALPSRRRQWHPTPVLLPGKSHGQRSLVGCSPWGREESDMTERLHFHFSLSCTREGNGNPLQCSCLENPRDGGTWWAAVYGVAQSWTWLKWLSSSSLVVAIKLDAFHAMNLLWWVICTFWYKISLRHWINGMCRGNTCVLFIILFLVMWKTHLPLLWIESPDTWYWPNAMLLCLNYRCCR